MLFHMLGHFRNCFLCGAWCIVGNSCLDIRFPFGAFASDKKLSIRVSFLEEARDHLREDIMGPSTIDAYYEITDMG